MSTTMGNARSLTMVTLALFASLALAASCDDERLDPAPSGGASPAGGAGAGGASGGGGEGAGGAPGPRIREVFYRNPMGSPPNNLFADGDFELSIVPEANAGGQYAWNAFTMGGTPTPILAETGGLCRSGIRCGRVDGNRLLLGRGAAAPDEAEMIARVWVKPLEEPDDPAKPCELGSFIMIRCDTFQLVRTLNPADAPDERGWCEISADVGGQEQSLCLFAEPDVDMLIDNATLLPVAGASGDALPVPTSHPNVPLEAAQLARLENLRDIIRRRTPFGQAPAIVDDPSATTRVVDR